MDRKQEMELAAKAEIDSLNGLEGFDRTDMINMFSSGVTWADAHPKNQWIDTRERKGSDSSADCILILEGGSVTRGYYYKDSWLEYPEYENVLDDVCYWMDCDLFKD